MSVQRLPKQHADHLVPGPDPLGEAEVIDLGQQGLRQMEADLLLGDRFSCHVTYITYISGPSSRSDGTIIAYTSGAVNDIAGPRGIIL
jgi:hypothetical protein